VRESNVLQLNVYRGKLTQFLKKNRENNHVLMCSQYQAKYELRHVCLSVRMEQLGSKWKDFHET